MRFEAELFGILALAGDTKVIQRLPGIGEVIAVEFAKSVRIRSHGVLQTVKYFSRYKGLSHKFWAHLTRCTERYP
jgi:hypothetical protein